MSHVRNNIISNPKTTAFFVTIAQLFWILSKISNFIYSLFYAWLYFVSLADTEILYICVPYLPVLYGTYKTTISKQKQNSSVADPDL